MLLERILAFPRISIQCHDNPDADAIASGFALYSFFKAGGADVRLFYSGKNRISKAGLLEMMRLLDIPLNYVAPGGEKISGLLLTVDCQYGAGNVSLFPADAVAVIDHHVQERDPPELHDIRPALVSCSTLVWSLLALQGFRFSENALTALQYGLFMDSGGFSEVRHPLDRDLRDVSGGNERIVKILKNSNLSLDDLSRASFALANISFEENGRFALVEAEPCDPNLMGFISDLAMQVDKVDIAIAFSTFAEGTRFSVRTVLREARAADIARWFAGDGLGSGGGHAEKAGGFIGKSNLAQQCPGETPERYFRRRLQEYATAYRVIDCGDAAMANPPKDIATLNDGLFAKLPVCLRYARCADLFPNSATLTVRMLEGDITIAANPDTYLMIGLAGEAYPIDRRSFEKSYEEISDDQQGAGEAPYPPTVIDVVSGRRIELDKAARRCRSMASGTVRGFQLARGVKVFTRWDRDNYLKGEEGDWLVIRADDPSDIYVVKEALFPRLYGRQRDLQEGERLGSS